MIEKPCRPVLLNDNNELEDMINTMKRHYSKDPLRTISINCIMASINVLETCQFIVLNRI